MNAAASGNYIAWNSIGAAAPAFTTRSAGTKLVLSPSINASQVDYAIGVETSAIWYSTQTASSYHRWYAGTTQVMNLTAVGLVVAGKIYNYQATSIALTTAGATTLTIAQLINGIIVVTQTAAVTLTMPTGTATQTGMIGGTGSAINVDQTIDWSIINHGSSLGAVTLAQSATAHGIIGALVVAIGVSAQFRTIISATNIALTYRSSQKQQQQHS